MEPMLPRFNIEIEIARIDPVLLRVIWIDEVSSDGVGDNRLYEDFSGAEWTEVQAVTDAEEGLLQEAAQRAADIDDFDRIVDHMLEEQYPGDEFDEGPLSRFAGLDAGVMSAVAALSASGCISTTSCRGHRVRGEPSPLVRFTADEERLIHVLAAVSSSGCGLLLDEDGMLQLYAMNVLAFVAFARELQQARHALDSIETVVPQERPPSNLGDFTTVRWRDLEAAQDQVDSVHDAQCDGQLALFESDPPPEK